MLEATLYAPQTSSGRWLIEFHNLTTADLRNVRVESDGNMVFEPEEFDLLPRGDIEQMVLVSLGGAKDWRVVYEDEEGNSCSEPILWKAQACRPPTW
jgi:hypothetical protein